MLNFAMQYPLSSPIVADPVGVVSLVFNSFTNTSPTLFHEFFFTSYSRDILNKLESVYNNAIDAAVHKLFIKPTSEPNFCCCGPTKTAKIIGNQSPDLSILYLSAYY